MANTTLWTKQQELGQHLASAPTDKDRVKLLLDTIAGNNTIKQDDDYERISIIAYCIGYLSSLLVKYGLYD